MSSHSGSHHSDHSYGSGGLNGLLGNVAHDIANLISDILKLLESHGCCPPGCHPPCYCPGTLIETAKGDVAVEALEVGDMVLTASGQMRPIRWIGRRDFDIARHVAPALVKPVRIVAGAFGFDLPRRDLFVSPGHSIFVEDVLIPVRFLLNGVTVAQDQAAATVTYFHVELDQHDVILAEGLPAESYLDTGNRSDFENGGQTIALHPTFTSKDWADTCAPLVKSGATVEAVKRQLLRRAETFGYRVTEEHDLHIMAEGRRVDATRDGSLYSFAIPGDVAELHLISRVWVPAHLSPRSQDDRELGVCVARLEADGTAIDLSTVTTGWNAFDDTDGASYRWTSGRTELPVGTRKVAVELCGAALYWAEIDRTEPALREAA